MGLATLVLLVVLLAGPAASPTPQPSVMAASPTALPWQDIGLSFEGRPIKAAVFGDGPQTLLVIGGIHGDEHGDMVARAFATSLNSGQHSVPAGWSVHVIGSLNPDGEHHGTRANARGVDLNRNLPTENWSASLDPGDRSAQEGLTGGAGPASEPETRVLVDYLARGFSAVVALHSVGGIIDYDGDASRETAERMSTLCGLPVQHLEYQGHVTGSLGQYVSQKYGVPMITVELAADELPGGLAEALLAACR